MVSVVLAVVGIGVKLLAFWRDLLIADAFGATRETDAFFLVNVLWAQIAVTIMGTTSQVFIPRFLARSEAEGDEVARRFAGVVMVTQVLIAGTLAVAVYLGADELAPILANEFDAEGQALVADLLRLCAPIFPLCAAAGVPMAVARARNHFFLVQASMLALNLAVVVALLIGVGQGIRVAAIGLVAGSALMLGVVVLYFVRERFLPKLGVDLRPGVAVMGLTLVLVGLGHSGGYLMLVVSRYFYALLPPGHFSCHGYALRVISLPNQVLMPAVLTAVLPAMSAAFARADPTASQALANRAMRMLLASMVPLCVVAVGLRMPIVRFLYERGAFQPEYVDLTATILACLLPAILFGVCRNVVATAFYAAGAVWLPTMFGVLGVVVFAALGPFVWERGGAPGLALVQGAADGAALVGIVWLARARLALRWPGLASFCLRLALACVPVALLALGIASLSESLRFDSNVARFLVLAMAGLTTAPLYVLAARWVGLAEVAAVTGLVGKRLGWGR